MSGDKAVATAMKTRQINRSVELLMGMVTGIVADNHLHDLEIGLLSTWLSENTDAASTWPGSLIARKVREILADGVITEVERAHLLDVLKELAVTDFSVTGSASAEVSGLPINDDVSLSLVNAGVCHTGVFLFGTRAACERVTLAAGGMPLDSITKRTDILVVGTRVSPDWAHTSFGRKLQRAVALQDDGHELEIISERRWLEVAAEK